MKHLSSLNTALKQSDQPKRYYHYDGITGVWLWLPWKFHIALAVLAWPIAFWILPNIPFPNIHVRDHFESYRLLIGGSFCLFFILSAGLSQLKIMQIQKRYVRTKPNTNAVARKKEIIAPPIIETVMESKEKPKKQEKQDAKKPKQKTKTVSTEAPKKRGRKPSASKKEKGEPTKTPTKTTPKKTTRKKTTKKADSLKDKQISLDL